MPEKSASGVTWIRKHRIGSFSLAVLALAGFGAALILFYFSYCFTLKWAKADGTVDWNRREAVATYTPEIATAHSLILYGLQHPDHTNS